jgi:hypothetical protein
VNQLFNSAAALQEFIPRLTEFTDIEPVLPRVPSALADLPSALVRCDEQRSASLALLCLLVADAHARLRPEDYHRLVHLSIAFGLYDRACHACRQLLATPLDSRETFAVRSLEAKALRGLGKYAEAREAYRAMLKNCTDEFEQTGLLLNLAKVAHTSEWRTGYYQSMLNTLLGRLRTQLVNTAAEQHRHRLRYWLGVCLDSCAKVALETGFTVPPTAGLGRDGQHRPDAKDRCVSPSPEQMLQEAIEIAETDGPQGSLQRRLLHDCYFKFHCAVSIDDKRVIARRFERILEELGSQSDPRGLGVRYGQLLEINTHLGFLDRATHCATHALRFARLVGDWRALARNHLRAARLTRARGLPFADFEQHVVMARLAIKRLGGQHPEIEIEIERENTQQLQSIGRLRESNLSLSVVRGILDRLEDRVLADFHEHSLPEDKFCPPERALLTPAEWSRLTASLVVDYRMLSTQLRDALEQASRFAAWSAREESVENQLWVLGDYMDSVEHWAKHVVNTIRGPAILPVLQHAAEADRTGPLGSVVRTIENQLEIIEQERDRVRHDLSIIKNAESKRVSVKEVCNNLDLTRERSLEPPITIELPEQCEDDFELVSQEPLLRQAVMHLAENAAVAVHERAGMERRIKIRVSRELTPEGRRFGVLEIEDTGGGAARLSAAVERVRGTAITSPSATRVSGLFIAHRTFRKFAATFNVFERPSGVTALRIEFPHDGVHVFA